MMEDKTTTGDGEPNRFLTSDGSTIRVLFAVDSRFPGVGGAEIQSLKLANALRDRGVEVDFVIPYMNKSRPIYEEIEGFSVTKLDYPQIKLWGSFFLAAKFAWYLYKNQHRYDCVHIHVTRIFAATAGLIRSLINCTLVTKISGFFEFEGGVLDQKKRYNPINLLIRCGLTRVDYVQTISIETREKLEAAGFRSEQIRFIPNGIELGDDGIAVQSSGGTDQPLVIGYCGRMRFVKGVHVLIAAFATFVTARPDLNVVLRIAGYGETEEELFQQVRDLNLGDKVEFLGYVAETEAFLDTLDLYVQPSFAEGLPNSVIEAMSRSRAVLATNIGGNNELVTPGHNGLLFEAGDSEMLAQHIGWCADNRDELVEMGRNSRQIIADKYHFTHVTNELVKLYTSGSVALTTEKATSH